MLGCEIAPENLRFSAKQRSIGALLKVLTLVRECFSTASGIRLEKLADPDSREEWLNLTVTVSGDLDRVMADYNCYTDRWVAEVPWPAVNKITLSPEIT